MICRFRGNFSRDASACGRLGHSAKSAAIGTHHSARAREQGETSMAAKASFITAAALLALAASTAAAENAPGVTAAEIKIGQTMPYSGPASAYGVIGKTELAFFKMINDNGGVNGRKIVLLSEDDGYNPAKTVEQTRKLVESDNVAFILSSLGTATSTATEKYLNDRKIPQLFLMTGADKFGDYRDFPWTMGYQPSYRIEAVAYGKYILKVRPQAKIAVLFQNDDFGKDYVNGLKEALGARYASMVVKEASYEVTDTTLDTQVIALQASGADTLLMAATPKFAAQAIRKVYTISWKPALFFMSNVSASATAVFEAVGRDKATGIISAGYQKDPDDQAMANDAGMREFKEFMHHYMPDADANDFNYVTGYNVGLMVVHMLKQCGNDLSRENIMRQAVNFRNVELPMLLPGIRVNTSPTNYHPLRQLLLMRWNGHVWEHFGEVLGDVQS
jgi:branched-chain amino acid transport system substrate-binding protein